MDIQHQQILAAAKAINCNIKDVSAIMGGDAAVLEYQGKSELLIKGTPTSLITSRSQYYCDNKALTKEVFKHLDIPAPRSILFQHPEEKQVLNFFKTGNIYVCKPPDGTNGVGVEMNITSLEAISNYWQKHKNQGNFFLLEEQIDGEDLRVQVVGGKIVAVCTREPAHVIGDGQKSIQKLIDEFRIVVKSQNPANDLWVDQVTKDLLADQQLTLSDVPSKGQKVVLKELANMAQGAIAIDKTEDFHPGFQNWIDKIVSYLGTPYFAIDIIAPDCTKPPEIGAWVLEINARPEWLHHTFSQRKKHDMGRIVVEALFLNEA